MNHNNSYVDFSQRLVFAMKQAGHEDKRSSTGISIALLAKSMDVSEQICRRYLRGDARPDYDKISKLAKFLHVSPGWLLFGDENHAQISPNNMVQIDKALLHYTLEKSYALYLLDPGNSDDYPDFVLSLINDISTIDATNETLKKIIDLAVGSICSFEKRKKIKKA